MAKRKISLSLKCEWKHCADTSSDMVSFTNHVKSHLQSFALRPAAPSSSERANFPECIQDEMSCQWVDCFHVTYNLRDLLRHLYFHAFHTKLKWVSQQELQRAGKNPCLLDSQSRNLIPELPEQFVCSWELCEFTSDNAEAFYRHVDSHVLEDSAKAKVDGNGLVVCKWEGCSSKTKTKFKLRDHMRSHTQEKVSACSVCGGVFSNRTKFFDHLDRQIGTESRKYQCSHCSKTFATERLLRDHIRIHVSHYKCPFCEMTCPSPSSLKSHIRWRHCDDRPFKCEICPFRSKTIADLKKHMDIHNDPEFYKCGMEGCAYSCSTMSRMRYHFKTQHNQGDKPQYYCHVCEKIFKHGGDLTHHLKRSHNFLWPPGHCRFRYKEHDDGTLRLQMVRYESFELTEQLINEGGYDRPDGKGGKEGGHRPDRENHDGQTLAEEEGYLEERYSDSEMEDEQQGVGSQMEAGPNTCTGSRTGTDKEDHSLEMLHETAKELGIEIVL